VSLPANSDAAQLSYLSHGGGIGVQSLKLHAENEMNQLARRVGGLFEHVMQGYQCQVIAADRLESWDDHLKVAGGHQFGRMVCRDKLAVWTTGSKLEWLEEIASASVIER
jgi:hypothetical protein